MSRFKKDEGLKTNFISPFSEDAVSVHGIRVMDTKSDLDGSIRYRKDKFQFREDGVWKTLDDGHAGSRKVSRTLFIPPDKITPIDVQTSASPSDIYPSDTCGTTTGFALDGGLVRVVQCMGGPKHVLVHEVPTHLTTTHDYFSPDGGVTTSSLLDAVAPGVPARLKKIRCMYHISGPGASIMECIISKRELHDVGDTFSPSVPFGDATTHTTSDCPHDPSGGHISGMFVAAIGNLSVSADHATTALRSAAGYHVVDFLLDDPIDLTSAGFPLIRLWFYGVENSTSLLYHGTILFIEETSI